MKPLSLLVSALVLLVASAAALAAPPNAGVVYVTPSGKAVYRSGATYYVNACERPSRVQDMQCYAKIVTDAKGNPLASTTTTKGYTASDLRSAYGVTPNSFDPASTPTVAVVIPYHHAKLESNLAVYRSTMKLPACTSTSPSDSPCLTIVYQGTTQPPPPPAGSNWGVEASLDVQMVSAMCPQCRIAVYEANSADSADTSLMVNRAAGVAGVIAVSNSYGTTEANWFADTNIVDDALLFRSNGSAAVIFASGDSGYGVNCPACLNTVLAVGGTKLTKTTTGRLWSETAWSKAGSGCDRDTAGLDATHAALYARPSWNQTQMPPLSTCGRRMVADVSAVADPSTGVAVYAACGFNGLLFGTSSWCVIGGTSVSAPLWAGIIGNRGPIPDLSYSSQCSGVTTQNRIGCFLYYKAASYVSTLYNYNTANAQLWDVTSGSNGSCSSSILCTAKVGYDGPTGLGTPKASVLTNTPNPGP